MPPFILPIDPLLQQSLVPQGPLPGAIGSDAEPGGHEGENRGLSSDEDEDEHLNPNKRPRLGAENELFPVDMASSAEREAMSFALGLEVRDSLHIISNAVVSTNVHPDLVINIKAYTAAAFFSPFIRFYAPPTNSSKNKELQKAIL
ncbi:hypothetical protein FRC11_003762, partial [Ceratobasidium sp. 423]